VVGSRVSAIGLIWLASLGLAAELRAESGEMDSMNVVVQALSQRIASEEVGHDFGKIPPPNADLYKLYISSQDGPHCTFSLTCSSYAKQALRKKGLVKGFLLAADRLLRCHGLGSAQYPVDSVSGKLLDPVP
jgi:putative component of membrane protein insertase Oxa1/YidC/SpoIIIJ protein YidD